MAEAEIKEWLTPGEAADYAGLSKPRMYAMIKEMVVKVKEIPPEEREHRGARMLVDKDSIDTYLANYGRPREVVTGTRFVKEPKQIIIGNAEVQRLLKIPIGDFLAAYKEARIDRTVYTIREAARVTSLEPKFITKLCELGMLECISDERGKFAIPEKELTKLKDRAATA